MNPSDEEYQQDDRELGDEPTVTVCAACLQASCWQGVFYCDEYRTAGTVEKTRAQLEGMNLEHPSYWTKGANA